MSRKENKGDKFLSGKWTGFVNQQILEIYRFQILLLSDSI